MPAPNCVCPICGVAFYRKPFFIRRAKGELVCSKECEGKYRSKFWRGKNHPQNYKKNTFALIVTNDEYELPVAPPMPQVELERFLGLSHGTISHYVRQDPNRKICKKTKYIIVKLDEDDEDEDYKQA